MEVKFSNFTLPYGESGTSFSLPERNVLKHTVQADTLPIDNPGDELLGKIANPIGWQKPEYVLNPGKKVLLVCADYTRLTPAKLLLPPLLNHLNQPGIKESNIRILVEAGFHRIQFLVYSFQFFFNFLRNRRACLWDLIPPQYRSGNILLSSLLLSNSFPPPDVYRGRRSPYFNFSFLFREDF